MSKGFDAMDINLFLKVVLWGRNLDDWWSDQTKASLILVMD